MASDNGTGEERGVGYDHWPDVKLKIQLNVLPVRQLEIGTPTDSLTP
jgi:hypothetical protein